MNIFDSYRLEANTDLAVQMQAYMRNQYCSNKEFFKNKAIGWALREYAKTNPEWVIIFININNLSNLSKREASKHLSV